MPIGPVPFTLQNFAIGLIATVFRPREAVLSVGLYLLLGAIGLPVFANGGAGFHVLVGPSAGYFGSTLSMQGLLPISFTPIVVSYVFSLQISWEIHLFLSVVFSVSTS